MIQIIALVFQIVALISQLIALAVLIFVYIDACKTEKYLNDKLKRLKEEAKKHNKNMEV